ncbi:MAG: aminoacyl--tRNA ligase-related protein, partial [Candidatus Heimdallarchaeota archaeon]
MFHSNKTAEHTKTIEDNKLINKESNFWTWYLWILQEARIVDTSYGVKGSYVWLDWGYKIFDEIYSHAKKAYQASGHNQMQFPTLIKEEIFLKETDFIRNFEDDVFWVDREGHKTLQKGERMALRPTSELIIYPMFAKWIQSWRDLPLKVFQNVSIFRCETNETRPLIRNRETIGFIEGHSAFASETKAMEFLSVIWETYQSLFEKLGIPVKLIEVPSWERFAGSTLTIDGYVILPGSKSMELFTTAYLGTTFSDIFDIQFLDDQKTKQKVHLLCYGPSIDRILASLISMYGDNRGLQLLPEISPVSIIIIPIFNSKTREQVLDYVNQVSTKLLKMGFQIEIDLDDTTRPGSKFYRAERLGIPLRIEIGQKEITQQSLTVTRRDTLTKTKITLEDKYLKKHLKKLLNDISKSLREKVKTDYQNRVIDASQFRSLTSFQSSTRLEKDHMYL